ncbi:MAG: hypothetical protein KZQ99_21885, partial [Candidatus Thiodiazotropha sp. (ex Dulcina madagascariensis)]|nr:hypothetical protein [Candidatus Thiodiazotropha sp. (ex Dulcina madagascariensis)]
LAPGRDGQEGVDHPLLLDPAMVDPSIGVNSRSLANPITPYIESGWTDASCIAKLFAWNLR